MPDAPITAHNASGDLLVWVKQLEARIAELESKVKMSGDLETRVKAAFVRLGGKL
jgi:hypothetical protein